MRVCLGERPPPLRPDGRMLPAPSAVGLAAIREALFVQVPLISSLPLSTIWNLATAGWRFPPPLAWPQFGRPSSCRCSITKNRRST